MCYLCLGSNPFSSPVNGASSIQRKRERALEIKKIIMEAEDKDKCDFGETVIEALKREQYRLSRDM